MAFDPSSAKPVSQTQSSGGGFDSSTARPVQDSQMEDATAPFTDSQNVPSPISLGQHALISLPNTTEYKLKMLNSMKTKSGLPIQASLADDGHILANGVPISPTPQGYTDFFKRIGDYAADQTGPFVKIGTQIAADALTLSGNPEAGIPMLAGANAIGAGIGEAGTQIAANVAGKKFGGQGEPISPSGIAGQAALGAASSGVNEAVLKPFLGMTAQGIKGLAGKFGDMMPDVFHTVGDLDIGQGTRLAELVKKSDPSALNRVLNPNFALPKEGEDIAARAFFGGQEVSAKGFLLNASKELSQASPADAQILKNFYSKHFGLSDSTLETLSNGNPMRLLNPALSTASMSIDEAKNFGLALDKYRSGLSNEWLTAANKIAGDTSQKFSIADEVSALLSSLSNSDSNISGQKLLTFDKRFGGGAVFNKDYPNPQFLDKMKKLLSNFGDVRDVKNFGTIFSPGGSKFNPGGTKQITNLPASRMLGLVRDIKSLTAKAINSPSITAGEEIPFSKLSKSITDKLSGSYDEFKAVNAKYANYYNLKDGLKLPDISPAKPELNDILDMHGKINSAISDPQKSQYLDQLSNLVGNKADNNIVRKMSDIGAAGEIQKADRVGTFIQGPTKLLSELKGVNNIDDISDMKTKGLGLVDSALSNRSKFLNDAKDHVLATELQNPRSLFSLRRLMFLTGGGSMLYHNPMVGIPAMMGLNQVSNPKSLARMAYGVINAKIPQMAGTKQVAQVSTKALLASLLRNSGRN